MPNTKRTQLLRGVWELSHVMMNSRERRLFSWSNATCAMPSCEALSSRRGRGPHHAQKDRVGTWDISRPAVRRCVRGTVRTGKVRRGPSGFRALLLLLIDPAMRVDFVHDLGRSNAVRVAKLADDCCIDGRIAGQ
jgi:hypothetical protein